MLEPLSPLHRRILGVLVEKQKTAKSADAYPLTLNSLVLGCNQKSNRDPVMDLSEDDVEEALPALQANGTASKITGSRVDRWKHLLYEKWNVSAAEMAVLAELLLRGPQTLGDLRSRADRMNPFATQDDLQAVVKPLAERGLVVYLGDPDRRGAMITHGFHLPGETTAAVEPPRMMSPPPPPVDSKYDALQKELADLRHELADLKKQLGVA